MNDDIAEREALYEKVKARLDAAEQAHIEKLREEREAGDKYNNYGHDLWSAIARAEFRKKQEEAATFLRESCDNNVFAAFPRIVRVILDANEPTKSGETPEAMLKRALEYTLRDLGHEVSWAKRRRGEKA